jgi:putative transposase
MRKSKVSETQLVAILKQADAGVAVKDPCYQAALGLISMTRWGKRRASRLVRRCG